MNQAAGKTANHRAQRRVVEERILLSAARVFGRSGYAGATLQEVASEAGVTKPTLYNYFKNKKALYQATLEWVHALLLEQQEAAAASAGSIYDRILAVLRVKVGFAREYAELLRAVHSGMFAPEADRLQLDPIRPWRARYDIVNRLVREGLARGELQGDPMDVSLVITDVFDGLALAQALVPSLPVLQPGIEERLWNVIYQGVKKG